MNIVCVEPLGISREHFETLKGEFAAMGHSFDYYMDRREEAAALAARMGGADVAVISNIKLPAEVLAQCPRLKYLSVAFTGLDHIDLAYCEAHGIGVQNAAGYSTVAVSELAVGLMIDVLRHVSAFNAAIRTGGSRGQLLGRELHGKTVGVVGTGAIGTAVVRLLAAFGCRVLAYSRTRRSEVEALGAAYTDLDTLVRESDIVTLHVPLNGDTRHLIDRRRIGLMKPSAILVNTARGGVADYEALAEALKAGRIAGAGIDVYEQEPPLPQTHPLLGAPNCVCVPHIGYASREAFDIRAGIVFDHVREYLAQV